MKRNSILNLTIAYKNAVDNLIKAYDNHIPGGDYLTNVANDGIYKMCYATNLTRLYPRLELTPDIVSKCGNGEFAVCRERLLLTLNILEEF